VSVCGQHQRHLASRGARDLQCRVPGFGSGGGAEGLTVPSAGLDLCIASGNSASTAIH
jgi:hypothetical protein